VRPCPAPDGLARACCLATPLAVLGHPPRPRTPVLGRQPFPTSSIDDGAVPAVLRGEYRDALVGVQFQKQPACGITIGPESVGIAFGLPYKHHVWRMLLPGPWVSIRTRSLNPETSRPEASTVTLSDWMMARFLSSRRRIKRRRRLGGAGVRPWAPATRISARAWAMFPFPEHSHHNAGADQQPRPSWQQGGARRPQAIMGAHRASEICAATHAGACGPPPRADGPRPANTIRLTGSIDHARARPKRSRPPTHGRRLGRRALGAAYARRARAPSAHQARSGVAGCRRASSIIRFTATALRELAPPGASVGLPADVGPHS